MKKKSASSSRKTSKKPGGARRKSVKKRPAKRVAKRVAKKRPSKSASNAPRSTVFGTSPVKSGKTDETGAKKFDSKHRLQKVLAAAGFGSRRNCEELITEGRVEIDRKVVTELGTKVDPMKQEIRVDGESIPKAKPVYIALYKPKGTLCTNRDQQGRTRAVDLVPEKYGRLFTIGRLDLQSEGLILLSNDGTLAERLTHPKYGVEKTYRVQVLGLVENETLKQLKEGVYLAEGLAKVTSVIIRKKVKQSTVLDIVLEEGMNREIRRILARLGHKVVALMRISVGPIKLGKMFPGEYRVLTSSEIKSLYDVTAKD